MGRVVELGADADIPHHRQAGLDADPGAAEAERARFGVPLRQLYGGGEAGSVTINLDEDVYEVITAPDGDRNLR